MEEINSKINAANNSLTNIKELQTSSKTSKAKIENSKDAISTMEKNLESMNNEQLNIEGKIKNI